MLDVFHYLFETDVDITSREHLQTRSATRKIVYKNIYNVDYAYSYGSDSGSADDYDSFADSGQFTSAATTNDVKPYFPPTQFDPDAADPFKGALRERPLG
jgi:hypothetical protein